MSVRANFADVQGMRGRSMRSGMELTREIQPTDWSTTGEQGKLVFIHFTFYNGKKSSFDRPNCRSVQYFHFQISVKKKKVGKKLVLTRNYYYFFFVT